MKRDGRGRVYQGKLAKCKGCGYDIMWNQNKDGKWYALNAKQGESAGYGWAIGGDFHKCEERKAKEQANAEAIEKEFPNKWVVYKTFDQSDYINAPQKEHEKATVEWLASIGITYINRGKDKIETIQEILEELKAQ